jgi:single-stranded-DNA-specific exonuclease
MREQALLLAESLMDTEDEAPAALCVFDEDFHEGVVGIIAGRLKDLHYRPCFVFASSQSQGQAVLKGSGRSIAGFHLRDALDAIAKRHPHLLLRFGGHAMAAGCTLLEDDLALFEMALQDIASEWLDEATLAQTLATDGSLPQQYVRPDLVKDLQSQVWGQGFAAPVFQDTVHVMSQKIVGEKHLSLKLQLHGLVVDAIWFGRTQSLPVQATVAYRLDINHWQGMDKVQLQIEAMQPFYN